MKSYDVVGYTYNADEYCPECTLNLLLNEDGIKGEGLSLNPNQAIERLGVSKFGGEKYDDGASMGIICKLGMITQDDSLYGDSH